jgi:hypothetical protein
VRQRDAVPDHNRAWEFLEVAGSEVSEVIHQEVAMNVPAVETLSLDEAGKW